MSPLKLGLLRTTALLCCLFLCVTLSAKPTKKRPNKKQKQHSRIINGKHVPMGGFLFAASLVRNGRHACGGSIVSHSFILSAAHCVIDKNNTMRSAADYVVSLGDKFWDQGETYSIDKIVPHQEYKRQNKVNDIALLRTESKITFGPTVSFIRLNPMVINEEEENVTATVLGWGYQDDSKGKLKARSASYVYSVDLFVLPWSACKKHYGKVIGKTQLCVSSMDTRGSCKGDSGGPLFTKVNEKDMQIGLVSFGGTCNNTIPEVYTRISSFYTWVRKMMKQHKFD